MYRTFNALVELYGGFERCRRGFGTASLLLDVALADGLITYDERQAGSILIDAFEYRLRTGS